MMKKIKVPKVAFIDDGISSKIVSEGVLFDRFMAIEGEVQEDTSPCENGHASMCYQIFREHVNSPYELVSIKVLSISEGIGTNIDFVAALKWCATQDIDVINLSMGTRQYTDFPTIKDVIVNNLSNMIIVAASSNENELTFPACLPSVIGVRHCSQEDMINDFVYLKKPYDQIEVMICAKKISTSDDGNKVVTMSESNSFAAPIITAKICDYIAKGLDNSDAIRQKLGEDAVVNTSFIDHEFYKKLLNNEEDLGIPIVAILDDELSVVNKIKAMIDVFVQDGYRAIGLSSKYTLSTDLIYPLEWYGEGQVSHAPLIKLYCDFTLPDILFLHMSLEDLMTLPEELQAEVVATSHVDDIVALNHWNDEHVLDIDKSPESLFLRIKTLFS
jgi:hypothetical protein